MENTKQVSQIAKDLAARIQVKYLDDPYAHIYPDIIDAFIKVMEVSYNDARRIIKEELS